MTEKRRRDEPQSGLPNGSPASNLKRALKSIVTVQSQIPEDAFTAQTLGEQRSGSGVVIRESGLVLTIGYLITEAEHVWLADAEGRVTPAHALAIERRQASDWSRRWATSIARRSSSAARARSSSATR